MKVTVTNHMPMDQMMRQTRHHHMILSTQADTKAQMLLSLAALLTALGVDHLNDPKLRMAAIFTMASFIITIVLAAYAVMPKMSRQRDQPKPDLRSPSFNIMFFGDFTRLDYAEFEQEMERILNDPSLAYEAMCKEIYALGTFLAHKKYRYVQLAYMVFICGMAVGGVMYVMAGLAQ